jgi:repressor LexA
MDAELTPRQTEILELIRHWVRNEGRPPTRADICAAFGFSSPNAAESHLKALARKGVIEMEEGRARGIRLVDDGLPVIGRVAAGSPMLAAENVERRIPVNPLMFSPQADFLLRVRGLSMRDAGILEGDLIAVHRTPDARNGQIVVARLGDEVTVKRLERRSGRLRLLPENPDFEPIEPQDEDFALEGVVVGLIRDGFPN